MIVRADLQMTHSVYVLVVVSASKPENCTLRFRCADPSYIFTLICY